MRSYSLEIIVFVAGAVVMVLELVGSRVLAPYLGTSLYVWTSLIGVILASLSAGYYIGGMLADRGPSYAMLSRILLGAAFTVFILAITKEDVLRFLEAQPLPLQAKAVMGTIVLFVLPTVFLGTISPYAARLRIFNVETSGRVVGNLYAISTAGSIVGTFLAGFFLIALIGTTNILYLLAGTLLFLSVLSFSESFSKNKIFFGAFLFFTLFVYQRSREVVAPPGFVDVDTPYNRVWIQEAVDRRTGKPIRLMLIGNERHSATFLNSDEPVSPVTKFFRLARYFRPDLKRALMMGGGGYSYPKDFLRSFPEATLDVVEIDPGVTELARQYFGLQDNPRLRIFHEDGRAFLNRLSSGRPIITFSESAEKVNKRPEPYDVIFGDAFGSFYSVPYQLTTKEAVSRIYENLSDGGVAIVDIISAISGPRGKFLRAEYWTWRAIFPQVYLFPVTAPRDPFRVQNIMLVAIKSSEKPSFQSADLELAKYLSHLWREEIPRDMPILTDDFAPVDQYIAELL